MESNESTDTTPADPAAPGLTLEKSGALDDENDNGAADVDEVIEYTFLVTNSGNQTVTDITIDDDRVEEISPSTVDELAPGETAEFTARYTVTQADVDSGSDVVNTATAGCLLYTSDAADE